MRKREFYTIVFMVNLSLHGVSKSFSARKSVLDFLTGKKATAKKALDCVSFSAIENAVIGIAGENGSGKTTLLRLIAGLLIPDEGRIFVFGKSPTNPEIKRLVGYASGERAFYWRLTARQNLEFFSRLHGMERGKFGERLSFLSGTLNAKSETLNKRFDALSGGEKKKFSLIKALLRDPRIILLDEPDKNLDSKTLSCLNAFLKEEKNRGKLVFYVSHNPALLKQISDEIITLSNGKIGVKNKREFPFLEAGDGK